jgi:isoaspartyl peptidase/L-asparaginase-like protein (Ntn-hydrolase superfamily)
MTGHWNGLGSLALVLITAIWLAGCGQSLEDGELPRTPPATWAGGSAPGGPVAVTHGGVGSPPEWSTDCQLAAEWAFAALAQASPALEAAVVGTMVMENNPRFNAGTGANIRLDGQTIQMDAAVMTSDGEFAAVAIIERVPNPVAVARAVLTTPHRLLAGEGATRFAHRAGFADVVPTCPEAVAKYQRRIQLLMDSNTGGAYDSFEWRRFWNYPSEPPEGNSTSQPATDPPLEISDTVGTVVRDAGGNFAVTLSTGGTALTLYGRVGDVPIYGCGCFAGPDGAVACTGLGEEIIRQAMARTVYQFLAAGASAAEAVRRGCDLFPPEHTLGLICVDREGWGVAANREMAYGMAASETP